MYKLNILYRVDLETVLNVVSLGVFVNQSLSTNIGDRALHIHGINVYNFIFSYVLICLTNVALVFALSMSKLV